MPKKSYNIQKDAQMSAAEPAVAYRTTNADISASNNWNPNVPFHGTQEEWWEHFHRIEAGNFMTLEEFDHKFEAWRTDYLANKLK